MNTQPTALRLADALENSLQVIELVSVEHIISNSAAELRRLHEVNQELVEALTNICMSGVSYRETADECFVRLTAIAKAALAKATGESNA